MSTIPALNGQVIGHAHYATRALLERAISPLGVTFNQVVALHVLAQGPVERAHLTHRVTNTLKIDESAVRQVVDQLVDADLARADGAAGGDEPRLTLTDTGRATQRGVVAAVADLSARLYAEIPADEARTAARVLTIVTQRANAELAVIPA
ncbi:MULTISPECIES: MarR family winged helix-turn-helix transcriptional regulator [Micromonospora]|uniref:MarR family winged helix-turn-helix transcriptional regulator n=1 Tax=Micromonospora TaxID=1873 RepID=UPI001EE954B3|nr:MULTISPECIES: MarR family winged helix-turn-helix transcriptional regulator [Micromonospora]MCG5451283.1 MarR family winged helix-turn-helix transcriptional regulator [Micromonospora hortensis]MCX5116491.1 MarR family winged helix-turn-helix transcriptional regulator [Micromonospora sp. NBC_00362]WTI05247.1 MarR family winged helix-turn-helix transcriptional regulator [Micromonospora sp. NBC_00821]